MNIHSRMNNLWTDHDDIPVEPRNNVRTSVVKMTSISQTSDDPLSPTGSSTSGSSQTTFTSTIQMSPGLRSRTTTSFVSDFPAPIFEPILLPPPSTFFDPFFARQVQAPRLFPSIFERRPSREGRPKRRQSPKNHPSSGYNSSSSGASLNYNQSKQPHLEQQEPIYEFPSESSTPINSPVPSTTSSSNETTSSSKSFKESLIRVLDEVDARVRFLRDTANELEEEKEKLLNTLSNLEKRNELSMIEEIDRDEVIATSKQLTQVLSSVNISIAAKRDAEQEKAFNYVNDLIKTLTENMTSPSKNNEECENAKLMVQVYLNTCTSATDPRVRIDEKFQKAIIACTIDDQKKFRKKLESLHKHTIY